MAFFVAFYSYKGGVGRTMALANTAYSLAAQGKKVLLLDMDLEAPGLQDYPEFALKGKGPKKGIVDFAAAFAKTGQCPSIRSYVHRCKEAPGTGELWLMPAGSVGHTYQLQLGKLNWRRLHLTKGTAPFIEGLKEGLIEHVRPDYVLIDSRTGLSDIGGLSTHRLANMVVLVFNLTRSCIDGSVRTYRSFVSKESAARFVQLVASPVPPQTPDRDSLVERRLAEAAEKMPLGVSYGHSVLRIDYNPAMVLAEELAVRRPEVFPAAARYEELKETIQRSNPDEVFAVLEQAQALRREGQVKEALAALQRFVESHSDDAEAHLALGNILLETGRAIEACTSFTHACRLLPETALTHRRLAEAMIATGHGRDALEELSTAARLGDQSPEFFIALSRAHASQEEFAQEAQARRRAILGILRCEETAGNDLSLDKLSSEFLDSMERRPPFAGFQALTFREDVLRSLTLSVAEKREILRQVIETRISPQEVTQLSRALRDEASRWLQLLGPAVVEIQERIAQEMIDPRDIESMARVGREPLLGRVMNKLLRLTADQQLPHEEGNPVEVSLTAGAVFFSGILGETGEYSTPPMRLSSLVALARGAEISAETLVDAAVWLRQGSR